MSTAAPHGPILWVPRAVRCVIRNAAPAAPPRLPCRCRTGRRHRTSPPSRRLARGEERRRRRLQKVRRRLPSRPQQATTRHPTAHPLHCPVTADRPPRSTHAHPVDLPQPWSPPPLCNYRHGAPRPLPSGTRRGGRRHRHLGGRHHHWCGATGGSRRHPPHSRSPLGRRASDCVGRPRPCLWSRRRKRPPGRWDNGEHLWPRWRRGCHDHQLVGRHRVGGSNRRGDHLWRRRRLWGQWRGHDGPQGLWRRRRRGRHLLRHRVGRGGPLWRRLWVDCGRSSGGAGGAGGSSSLTSIGGGGFVAPAAGDEAFGGVGGAGGVGGSGPLNFRDSTGGAGGAGGDAMVSNLGAGVLLMQRVAPRVAQRRSASPAALVPMPGRAPTRTGVAAALAAT